MKLVEMLNPFTSKKAGEAPDEQTVVRADDVLLERVLALYDAFIATDNTKKGAELLTVAYEDACRIEVPALNHGSLTAAFNHMAPSPSHRSTAFMSRVLQASFQKYKEQIILVAPDVHHDGFLAYLRGAVTEPIDILLIGDCGEWVATHSKDCRLTIRGDAKSYLCYDNKRTRCEVQGNAGPSAGFTSSNSQFYIHGNVDWGCGNRATDDRFFIKGNVSYELGRSAKDCRFVLGGSIDSPVAGSAEHCSFDVCDKRSYETLRKSLLNTSNTVNLLERMPTVEEAFK